MTLALENVSVLRGGAAILDRADINCGSGRVIAFCGPNGAGKSTALSVMSGAVRADRGRALFDGRPVGAFAPEALARRRAVVSQHSVLTFPFQVHEVVAMGRAPHLGRTSPVRDQEIIFEAMSLMDLTALSDRRFTTLSGGERQRVHIARALAQVWEPPGEKVSHWLLLDEPTAALDLKHQLALMQLLRRLSVDEGWGVIAVLHDLHLIKSYTDETVLFKKGAIVETGPTPQTLTDEAVRDVFDLTEPYALA